MFVFFVSFSGSFPLFFVREKKTKKRKERNAHGVDGRSMMEHAQRSPDPISRLIGADSRRFFSFTERENEKKTNALAPSPVRTFDLNYVDAFPRPIFCRFTKKHQVLFWVQTAVQLLLEFENEFPGNELLLEDDFSAAIMRNSMISFG